VIDSLCTKSAVWMAREIRERRLSSREAVDAHIRRIERVNPVINAVTEERFAAARAEADAADARIARGEARPFEGVPCTIKECYGLAGMRMTAGLWARRDHRAPVDGTAVARVRASGAIPLCVSNVSELMMWMETSNKIFGRTNNPYDPSRIVGGSSGGEGALVGAGASPIGLGGDIGGSIRMPAFFNGVFGHKPTGGMVPATGHWPMAENDARRYLTTGPIARRAEDLMPFLRAIAGPDGVDGGCREIALADPGGVDVSQLTVYDVEGNGAIAVSDELKAAQKDAAAHLASRGARVVPFKHAAFKRSFAIWSAMLGHETETSFAGNLGFAGAGAVARELVRFIASPSRSRFTLPALILGLVENAGAALPALERRAIELGRRLKAELEATLGPRAVLLYPPYPTTAPKHHKPLWPPFNWQYTAIWNVMELPVTQVPLGLDREGLPLGVQVVGGPAQDHVTIAVALELERRFGGWVPPPSL
jgi:fatty acid amide hydrolase 2